MVGPSFFHGYIFQSLRKLKDPFFITAGFLPFLAFFLPNLFDFLIVYIECTWAKDVNVSAVLVAGVLYDVPGSFSKV